ncbi:MAG TPA: ATP cone domain-containing protein, partial [Candidatus Brocadiales bacterium]|nr:ATP cone domain-containing protein [Candidatus Brocadiales bacterium]
MTVEMVQKRDGRLAPFNKTKIVDAIFKAASASGGFGGDDRAMAEELADLVTHFIEKDFKDKIPGI